MLNFVGDFIRTWYSTLGYGGIVLAMALESCLIPLPSEIVMPLAGAFTLAAFGAKFNLPGVAIAGALGCVIGSAVAYGIGARGGRPFIERYGKYLLISQRDFERADRWFLRFGGRIAFFSRLLPVVRTYISLPAGISGMSFGRFLLYSFLGSLPWCFVLAFVGAKLGDHYDQLSPIFHGADLVIGLAIVALVALYIWRHVHEARTYDAHASATPPTTPWQPKQWQDQRRGGSGAGPTSSEAPRTSSRGSQDR